VLSAVEGLEIAAPQLDTYVLPICLVIIIILFAVQRHGTNFVGKAFAPVMVIWFLVLAGLGLRQLVAHPQVLAALNPWYAVTFFLEHGKQAFIALGGVVLALTGAEALYADMGHFGKKPIRLAWFTFVLPALLINYFGQGALLLHDQTAIENPFYKMVPEDWLYPMVALSTMSAIIASQAVISGAFSMTREAMSLGYSPRMAVVHTSHEMSGQIFVPWVNRLLLVLVFLAVIGFRSSNNLGAAYGIAVTGTMVITSCMLGVLTFSVWRWPPLLAGGVTGLFLVIDGAYFLSNATKIPDGGWVPLVVAAIVFLLLTTWSTGRKIMRHYLAVGAMDLDLFIRSTAGSLRRVPGTAIFLSSSSDGVPPALLHNVKHNKILHERIIILTVTPQAVPHLPEEGRIEVSDHGSNFYRMRLRHGFMEDVDIPAAMKTVTECQGPIGKMDTSYFLSRQTLIASERPGMAIWREKLFAWMIRNAATPMEFFNLPTNRVVELGSQVEI
jgi:KUP system potassium uptake protein